MLCLNKGHLYQEQHVLRCRDLTECCTVCMQEYESAERCVDRILQMESNNNQAKQLKELIIKKLRRGQQLLHMYMDVCMCAGNKYRNGNL